MNIVKLGVNAVVVGIVYWIVLWLLGAAFPLIVVVPIGSSILFFVAGLVRQRRRRPR